MIEIKRWDTGAVIHSGEFSNLKECLEDGVSKGVNFYRAELNYAKLNYAKLNCAELNYAKLNCAELNRAELNYAKLNDAELNDAELNYAKLNYAELNRAELNDAELNDAKLNYAKLNRAELNYAELNDAELNDAELNYAKLNCAELNRAELNDAELPNMSVSICAGEDYYLFLSPDVVQAGCQSHSPDKWRRFTKKEIADMDSRRSLKYYPRLLDLMDFFLGAGERPEWLKVEGE